MNPAFADLIIDHELRVVLSSWRALEEGMKSFLFIKDDGFKVGQTVRLTYGHDSPALDMVVTSVFHGDNPCDIRAGYCVLSMRMIGEPTSLTQAVTFRIVRKVLERHFGVTGSVHRSTQPFRYVDKLQADLIEALNPGAGTSKPDTATRKVLRDLLDIFGPVNPNFISALDEAATKHIG